MSKAMTLLFNTCRLSVHVGCLACLGGKTRTRQSGSWVLSTGDGQVRRPRLFHPRQQRTNLSVSYHGISTQGTLGQVSIHPKGPKGNIIVLHFPTPQKDMGPKPRSCKALCTAALIPAKASSHPFRPPSWPCSSWSITQASHLTSFLALSISLSSVTTRPR